MDTERGGPLLLLLFAFAAAAITVAGPIMVGFERPISLLILGFALWEAWKMNKRTVIDFTGPYRVGAGAPPFGGMGPGTATDPAAGGQ